MLKNCLQCKQRFEVTDDDLALIDKISPEIAGKKFNIPSPTLCPNCRQQRRLAFRNERRLYQRICDLCKKSIIAIYPEDSPFTVYCPRCWWSDQWDAMSFGREFDFSRSFLDQFRDLWKLVPRIALIILGENINSDYTHDNYKLKNCFYVFDGEQGQDCFYGETFAKTRDCCDFFFLQESELCYETVNCYQCYDLKFSRCCTNCQSSSFLLDCQGCNNCIGCCNLREKQYHIFNEQYEKEDYKRRVQELRLDTISGIRTFRDQSEKFFLTQPKKPMRGLMNENVTGDNLMQCKDVRGCFDCVNCRDCSECTNVLMGATDSMGLNMWGEGTRLGYDSVGVGGNAEGIVASFYAAVNASNVYHSFFCGWGSSNLLGCIGLHHKKYCILNRQYSQEEYEDIVPNIIDHMKQAGEWAEFFPTTLSDYAYNETVAQDYFPLTKKQALEKGFRWRDEHDEIPQVERVIDAKDLPESIGDIPDDVLNWAIRCEVTGRPYRIQKAELGLYRRLNVPLPRKHFDVRYRERFSTRNPRKLWDRQCTKCGKAIRTSYGPDRPEIVYCEECYLAQVY